MNVVDVVVLVVAVAYAVSGFRNGALAGALSLGGFLIGAVIGAQLARPLGERLAHGQAQVPIAIVCVLIVALLGQLTGVAIARRLRRRITWRPARQLDSTLGAVLSVVGVLVVVWMLAVSLASAPFPSVAAQVRRSVVVHRIDDVMPDGVRQVYSSLRQFVDRSGFPQVFGSLTPTRIVDVSPPDNALTRSTVVRTARPSVVKILGSAPSCDRGLEGSGFVYAPERVMTNAHVVAGTDRVDVQAGGQQRRATVVYYNPDVDVAVLDVPGLNESALRFASVPARTGAGAVVAGYPQNGPFDAEPARVRDRETANGRDIYGDTGVAREIYAVRALVRSGNSGGPLLGADGSVLGVVFATALDSTGTGFVLTAREVAPAAVAGRSATDGVSTGACA